MKRGHSSLSVSSCHPAEDCPLSHSSPTTTSSDQDSISDRSTSPQSTQLAHYHPYAVLRQTQLTNSSVTKTRRAKTTQFKVSDRYKSSMFNRAAPTLSFECLHRLQARFQNLSARFGGGKIRATQVKSEKNDTEAGKRFELAVGYSCLEEQLLLWNSSLPKTAKALVLSEFHEGWKPLSVWNKSDDIRKFAGIEPYSHNKIHLLATALQFMDDSSIIIEDAVEERATTEAQILALLQSDPSKEAMSALLLHILHVNMSRRIAQASAERGSKDFQRPLVRGMDRDGSGTPLTLSPRL
jgi:hypothetical protein